MSECCVIWPPTGRPINTVTVDDILDFGSVELMVIAPSLLEELVQSPESLAKLENVDKIVTGGGKSNLAPFQYHTGQRLIANRPSISRCWRHYMSKGSSDKFTGSNRNRRTS